MNKRQQPTRFIRTLSCLTASYTLLAFSVGCTKGPPQAPQPMLVQVAPVETVKPGRLGAEPAYIAVVRGENETDFSFKVGGIVESIGPAPGRDWEEGTVLKAGTVLARLAQADFVHALDSAQARAELEAKTEERLRKLREGEAVSQQEFDVAKANKRTTLALVENAKQNLKDSELCAPFDGVVLARYVNSGVTVAVGQRVLRFANNSVMSVELGVPDRLVDRFSPGKEIDIEISAFEGEHPFRGRISEVGVAASQEGRLYRVVIKVPNPDGRIRSGMTATVPVGNRIRLSAQAVLVPLSALVMASPSSQRQAMSPASPGSGGSGSAGESRQLAVFVVAGGKAAQRWVRTGDMVGSTIIVTDGLKAGELVVSSGASLLYDGAPVIVVQSGLAGE